VPQLFGFGLFFLIACCNQAFAHERIVLDSRHASPGIRLEMQLLPPTVTEPDARYRLEAFGFPRGVKLLLWAKEFDHSIHQLVASIFQVDKSGNVMASNADRDGQPRPLDQMSFGPGPYPRGALWEVALISVDRKLQAFVKAIPHPISVRDGTCEIALQLVSHRGEKFLASGSGFVPGDNLLTESRYAGRVIEKRVRISAEGLLPPQVLLHRAVGFDHGAHYAVKGRSCAMAVEYNWGEPALSRR
jgi:hypothetical protein